MILWYWQDKHGTCYVALAETVELARWAIFDRYDSPNQEMVDLITGRPKGSRQTPLTFTIFDLNDTSGLF